MGFATEASTEWKMGGTHSSPTALGLGISAPHPPQISEFFVWDWEGAQKCFILRDQTTGNLTFTDISHSQPCLCPHGLLFLQQLCITVYSRNIIFCIKFFRTLTASSGGGGGGGGGGGTCPPGPPLGPALIENGK